MNHFLQTQLLFSSVRANFAEHKVGFLTSVGFSTMCDKRARNSDRWTDWNRDGEIPKEMQQSFCSIRFGWALQTWNPELREPCCSVQPGLCPSPELAPSAGPFVDEARCAAGLAAGVPVCGANRGLPEGEAAGMLPWGISRCCQPACSAASPLQSCLQTERCGTCPALSAVKKSLKCSLVG